MLLLRRHLLPLLRAISPLPSQIHHRACPRLSTSAAPSSLEDYLVAACGLAPAQARESAKKALDEASKKDGTKKAFEDFSRSRLRSASNPDAILALLSGVGLTRTDIASVVAADPLLLRSSVKNVGPRLLALRDRLGLSTPQIVRFLLVSSCALRTCDVVTKMEFFMSFYGSFERCLRAMKQNKSILHSDFERLTKTNIALLCQCGLTARDVAQLCSHNARLLTFGTEYLKECLLRAQELGASPPMLKQAIKAAASNSKENVASKLKFLKSILGCSESEVATIVSKNPIILGYSKEGLLRKIQFLTKEVGMEPQYIAGRPSLLLYSLKRLVPRHCVMKILQEKGLLSSKMGFFTLAVIGEETFKLKYIDCHKDSVPGLADAYATASAGVAPSGIKL